MADGELHGPVTFDLRFPVDADGIDANIAHSSSLGLPVIFSEEPQTLNIIASGPSAAGAPLDGPTLSLNGSIQLFLKAGKLPTYWAACDPQAEVADFLPEDPPEDVIYLVASKCHPSVFAKLKGRDVRLWHVRQAKDQAIRGVPSASSITLTAMSLFFMQGVRRFNIYGWDCCFGPDGEGHSTDQPKLTHEVVTITCGRKKFRSTRTWANEFEAARYLVPHYRLFGCEVNIHGRSMIKSALEYLGL